MVRSLRFRVSSSSSLVYVNLRAFGPVEGFCGREGTEKDVMPEGLIRRRTQLDRYAAGDTDDRGWTPLHICARKGDLKEVKRLLKEGMDANVAAWGPKSHGITPLHLAAKGGHLKVMDKLLERGADIDARTKGACGWTPLHNAAKERKRKAIRFLVENGAFLPDDINDTRFNPPLHYCPGLEWAYEEMRRLQQDNSSSGETTSYSSES